MTGERAGLADWRDALRDSQLDATTKLVGFIVSTYLNGSGQGAFPSRTTIAAGASKSVRTIDTALTRLEQAGFLIVNRSKGRTSNRYEAALTAQPIARLTAQSVARLRDANGATIDSQQRNFDPSTAQPTAPESDESENLNAYTRATRAGKRQSRANALTEEQEARLAYLDR